MNVWQATGRSTSNPWLDTCNWHANGYRFIQKTKLDLSLMPILFTIIIKRENQFNIHSSIVMCLLYIETEIERDLTMLRSVIVVQQYFNMGLNQDKCECDSWLRGSAFLRLRHRHAPAICF